MSRSPRWNHAAAFKAKAAIKAWADAKTGPGVEKYAEALVRRGPRHLARVDT